MISEDTSCPLSHRQLWRTASTAPKSGCASGTPTLTASSILSAISAIATGPSRNFCGPAACRPRTTFKNVQEGFGLPIVEAWGRFRRPSRYGDLLRMETRIQEFRTKSLLFRFEFYPETGRDLLAEGTATLVAIGPDWRARELPERIKKSLSQGK